MNRSADATIKGYYYQFNKTIEQIIALDKTASIQIEGIEDIDINSITGNEYVQCKYLSSKSYTNSAIREPLIYMLEHFAKNGGASKYTLYGYFADETTTRIETLTLDEIKNVLTYKENKVDIVYHTKHGISDNTLKKFLKVFSVEIGLDFEEHRAEVIKLLKKEFDCTDFEAENYIYNNSVRIILDKAKEKNLSDRSLTKTAFSAAVNCGKTLFSIWQKKYLDNSKYVKSIKVEFVKRRLNTPNKDKLLLLGKNVVLDNKSLNFPSFIENLIDKSYKINKALYTAKPITIVVDIDKAQLVELKRELIKRKVKINDGYEEIEFCAETFCNDPIINKKTAGQITRTSFTTRIISYQTFLHNHRDFIKVFHVIKISSDDNDFPDTEAHSIFEVKYVDDLTDILTIIN